MEKHTEESLVNLITKLQSHVEISEFVIKTQENLIKFLSEDIEKVNKNNRNIFKKGIFIGVLICVILNIITNLLTK